MSGQHKHAPYRVRLPEMVRDRLVARLALRPDEAANKFISDAVREKLDREEASMQYEIEFAAPTEGAANDLLRQAAAPGVIPMTAMQAGRLGWMATGTYDEVIRVQTLLGSRSQQTYWGPR
jgi:hypothetical protein